MLSASITGFAATVITVAQVGRQVYDASAAADPVGISIPTWLLALIQSVGIGALAVGQGYAPAIAANVLVGLGCCAIILIVGRKRARRWPAMLSLLAAAILLVTACAVAVNPRFAGIVGDGAALVLWLPQAVRVIRGNREAGLSLAFFLAGCASSALWIAYAGLVGQWRLGVPPLCALITLMITAFFFLQHRAVAREVVR